MLCSGEHHAVAQHLLHLTTAGCLLRSVPAENTYRREEYLFFYRNHQYFSKICIYREYKKQDKN
jgi:hypothetical protein